MTDDPTPTASDAPVTDRLSRVSTALPALGRAFEITRLAADVGFDWPDHHGVLAKIREELEELDRALAGDGDVAHEYGDLLFAMANLGRFLEVHPEDAVKAASERFVRRFAHIERELVRHGRPWDETDLDEMEALWQAAKRLEGSDR